MSDSEVPKEGKTVSSIPEEVCKGELRVTKIGQKIEYRNAVGLQETINGTLDRGKVISVGQNASVTFTSDGEHFFSWTLQVEKIIENPDGTYSVETPRSTYRIEKIADLPAAVSNVRTSLWQRIRGLFGGK